MYLLTVTVPGLATRPRSFRPRSTSITCSARSFGSRWSCSAGVASSCGGAPRWRGECRVLVRRGATRARPRDRRGRELVAVELDEQLRAGPDDLERGHADE